MHEAFLMPTDLPPGDLRLLLAKADCAARRLQRFLRLPYGELDDPRQDLLVDLIARCRPSIRSAERSAVSPA